MRMMWLTFPALLVLAGCNSEQPAPAARESAAAPRAVAAAAPPPTPVGTARSVKEDNDVYSFEYAWPAAADAIPGLKAQLEADLAKQKVDLAVEAKAAKRDAQGSDYPFRPYGLGFEWKTVTELPRWLSLSTLVYSDTGGAHPNYWFDAILWDKQADQQREVADLFTSKAALSAALRDDFCNAIDRQREKKRGEPVTRSEDGMFEQCLDPVDYVVILGSSNHTAFDRIGVLVPPYEAGPYAEGEYEVTLPVTPAVMAALRPQYRSSFALGR